MKLPTKATLIEVGPRDGFQAEDKLIPNDLKLEILKRLSLTGLSRIQATSFVNPKLMPQMADADELCSRLPNKNRVIYTGLALNLKGIERAYAAGLKHIDISVSASETHSLKNTGVSLKNAMEQIKKMHSLSKNYNMKICAGIQCAFGCVYEGKIPSTKVVGIAKEIINMGIDMFLLADTTGMANPKQVEDLITRIKPITKGLPIILHFHDTRGMGLANVVTALQCGVTHFDTAFGGMGGCPFVVRASGNIATEDTAFLMESIGVETGTDIKKIAECSTLMEKFLGKKLAGKIHRFISPNNIIY
jgi:hydroxymethylglutaryl-CoA lyase